MCIISAVCNFSSTACITSKFIWKTSCGCVFRCRSFGCSSALLVEFGTSHERGLVNGLTRLSGGIMLKGFLWAALCSLIFAATIHAQEVIVAREKKPERATRTPASSEQVASESSTPAPHKKARQKKSAPTTLTLEEMQSPGH